jgi:hypothetical protein
LPVGDHRTEERKYKNEGFDLHGVRYHVANLAFKTETDLLRKQKVENLTRGKRRDATVKGCTSEKGDSPVKGFFSHVMHNAAVGDIMEQF